MRRNQLSVSVTALALLTLAACGSQKDAGPASVSDDRGVAAVDLPLTGVRWTVNSLMDGDKSTSLPAGTENSAHLTFAKDGTVGGSLGCNTFTATAKVSGEKITLERLISTRRMCTGTLQQVEAHLTKVLDGKATFRLLHRGLTLTGPDDQGVVATAERTPAGTPTPIPSGQR
ncbi:META domain-containing protein [Streptomyces jumonjinensis]|uniref:META domain-containing protein n=1 Tax=Streptomyces jumonjinensis TaxID=1945 RepID=UPI0037AF076E